MKSWILKEITAYTLRTYDYTTRTTFRVSSPEIGLQQSTQISV